MLELEIGRTTCRKTMHPNLDNCDFQTNPALKRVRYKSVCWALPTPGHPAPLSGLQSLAGNTSPHLIPKEMLPPNQEHMTAGVRHALKGHRVERQHPPTPHMTYTT